MYNLTFHPQTNTELIATSSWYEKQKESLGRQFLDEVDIVINRIRANLLQFKFVNKKLHQAVLEVFPFVICYEFDKLNNEIFIDGVFHTSRNPKRRLRGRPKA